MRTWCCRTVLAAFVLSIPLGLRAQDMTPRYLQLAFDADGTVTLSAKGVSVRDILAEWARQCGCLVVNADKLAGPAAPVPVEFAHAPQGAVLESLLRPAAGYLLTPRRPGSTGVSQYETIYILAASSGVAGPPAAYAPPSYAAPAPISTPGSPDDEIPPVGILPPIRGDQPIPNLPAQQPAAARAPAGPNPNPTPNPQPGLPLPGGIMASPIVPITTVPAPPGPPAGQSSPPPAPRP
jgi:hypothetical protein